MFKYNLTVAQVKQKMDLYQTFAKISCLKFTSRFQHYNLLNRTFNVDILYYTSKLQKTESWFSAWLLIKSSQLWLVDISVCPALFLQTKLPPYTNTETRQTDKQTFSASFPNLEQSFKHCKSVDDGSNTCVCEGEYVCARCAWCPHSPPSFAVVLCGLTFDLTIWPFQCWPLFGRPAVK